MDWSTRDIINFIGFVFTWIVGAFTAGKIHEKIMQSIREHDQEIRKINKRIVTDQGEPLLVSYKAHDIITATCQDRMNERYTLFEKRISLHDDKLDKILDTVIRLEERGKSSRSDD